MVVVVGESDPGSLPQLVLSPGGWGSGYGAHSTPCLGSSGGLCLVNVLLFERQDSELREGTSLGRLPGGGAVLGGLAATLEVPARKARVGERPPGRSRFCWPAERLCLLNNFQLLTNF